MRTTDERGKSVSVWSRPIFGADATVKREVSRSSPARKSYAVSLQHLVAAGRVFGK
jgi:hypothetical protein